METQLQLRVCGSELAAGKSNIFNFLEEEEWERPITEPSYQNRKKKKKTRSALAISWQLSVMTYLLRLNLSS